MTDEHRKFGLPEVTVGTPFWECAHARCVGYHPERHFTNSNSHEGKA